MAFKLACPFDRYAIQVRMYPALITAAPCGLALFVVFPTALETFKLAATAAASCGLVFFLANVTRSVGKKVEQRLVSSRDGWPTTRFLRHSDGSINAITKARYHESLEKVVPGLKLPSVEQELADPVAADEAYESATAFLRSHSRDKKNALVLAENIDYGFRRNLYGLRATALCTYSVGFAACVGRLCKGITGSAQGVPTAAIGAVVCPGLFIVLWLYVRPEWVLEAAISYAKALLETIDTKRDKATKPRSK